MCVRIITILITIREIVQSLQILSLGRCTDRRRYVENFCRKNRTAKKPRPPPSTARSPYDSGGAVLWILTFKEIFSIFCVISRLKGAAIFLSSASCTTTPLIFFYLSRSAFSEILDHRAEIISGGFCYGLHMLPDLFSVVGTAGGFKYGNGLIDELTEYGASQGSH